MSGWGQGTVNNSIGWGQGKDNTANGWGTVYETSNSGDTALEITLVAPVNTVAPAISGTTEVGQTLTCSQGTWSNSPTSYTYQWKRGGVNIGGATNSTYVLVAADEGESIKCTVTATNGAGSASADSNTVTPTWEADAQAFITAASITDPTQQEAVNQLVVDLKGYSLWTKMKAVYPFVGGSASSHKWNLKDPRDLNAAFRLSFSGGWTHSANGALPNGTNAFASTFLDLSAELGSDKPHLAYYSRTNGNTASDQMDMGVEGQNLSYTWVSAWYNASGFSNVLARNSSSTVLLDGGATTDSRGLYQTNKIGTTAKLQRNGDILDTDTDSAANPTFYGVSIGALNRSTGNAFFTNRQCAFASIGSGLTDTEADNLYTAVQTFQTTLSRNV